MWGYCILSDSLILSNIWRNLPTLSAVSANTVNSILGRHRVTCLVLMKGSLFGNDILFCCCPNFFPCSWKIVNTQESCVSSELKIAHYVYDIALWQFSQCLLEPLIQEFSLFLSWLSSFSNYTYYCICIYYMYIFYILYIHTYTIHI